MMKVMKTVFFVIGIAFFSCSSSKKNKTEQLSEQATNRSADSLPVCVQKMISQYKQEEKQNPPRQIFSYLYKGKTVYYVTPPCCDFFSDLYDSNCNLIGHPDGGFTGRGDGVIIDFRELRTNEKLIWKDKRE
jgi:hypothetical protein